MPAQAASTVGRETIVEDRCVREEEINLTYCRQILDVLASGERSVSDLVDLLDLAQPHVSRHLRVLRDVGAVDVREAGRQRLYRLNPLALKPIHDWVASYQHLWEERFETLEDILEDLKDQENQEQG